VNPVAHALDHLDRRVNRPANLARIELRNIFVAAAPLVELAQDGYGFGGGSWLLSGGFSAHRVQRPRLHVIKPCFAGSGQRVNHRLYAVLVNLVMFGIATVPTAVIGAASRNSQRIFKSQFHFVLRSRPGANPAIHADGFQPPVISAFCGCGPLG